MVSYVVLYTTCIDSTFIGPLGLKLVKQVSPSTHGMCRHIIICAIRKYFGLLWKNLVPLKMCMNWPFYGTAGAAS